MRTAGSLANITLSATDGDRSDKVTYTLTDSSDGLFIADANTGIVTLQGSLNYERSTRHTIIAQAMSSDGSTPTTAVFAIDVINVNEITLEDTNPADNTVLVPDSAAVENLMLQATHPDNVPFIRWEASTPTSSVIDDDLVDISELFELTQPQDSGFQTLRVNPEVNLRPIRQATTVTLNVSVYTEFDAASIEDVNILIIPPDSIRVRVKVYLEGALE